MQKEKRKINANPVGADVSVRPNFEETSQKNKQNGITLIALIITIIVMLILVGVSITVALKGGLFSTAKQATKGTEEARDKEIALSNGEIQIDGLIYASIDDYLNKNPKLVEGWRIATDEERVAAWPDETVKNEKVKAITDGENTVPLPEGFQVSLVEGESTVSRGLVITDGKNEFVWIPVTSTYTEDSLGPLTGTDSTSKCVYDSQKQLNYYYGEGYFNYAKDFNYEQDKTNIETSINKYKGFYVGRYETTIDENGTIGSKANTTVLTAGSIIKEGKNSNNNQPYYYRWYGLYKVQKDMYAGKEAVFSTMITSKEWDAIMSFTGYGSEKRGYDTYTTKPDLSGSAYKDSNPAQYDVSKNIYDLAGNVWEWTLKPDRNFGSGVRVYRGGDYDLSGYSASVSSYDCLDYFGSNVR